MAKLNHVSIRVRDWRLSRDWYVENVGLTVQFELPEHTTAALQDAAGITLFVAQTIDAIAPSCGLFFEVDDCDATYRRLVERGVEVLSPPQKQFWGYGAELVDPDGYRIGLWDARTMQAHDGT
jgi:predicted enzyme related to lactoylglutathione lyase